MADTAAASTAPSAGPGSGRPFWRILLAAVAPLLGLTLFLLGWQAYVRIFDKPQYVLPAPSDIVRHLISDLSFYWDNARPTLWEAFLGFVVAFVIAMVVASVLAHSRFIERMTMPVVVLAQVTPLIAYAPAFVIWFGFGLTPILAMTAIVCGVPFLLNAVTGLRSVDPNLLELARSVDASTWEIYVRLRLPSALPSVFVAARVAVGLALLGAVLGEFFAGVSTGLGFAVKYAINHNLPLQLWAAVYVLAVLGAAAIVLIGGLERIVLHWHASQRS
ncbi:MAG: ABC transporter permease [Ilumatobacteraceae bacterium]